ncbi:MAG TPA: glycosyltransferase [Puia sp.]|nr:glycosyltransferase [Puia sp.]
MPDIPKKIHLIYKIPDIPEDYQDYYKIIKELHPFWDIKVYGDEEARGIIARHLPELLDIYDSYELDVQRTDIFRIAVTYIFGGFYMDLDMMILKSLDPLCNCQLVLGEEKTMSDMECNAVGIKHNLRIANYMFGAIPGHPFWTDVIKEAISRCGIKIKKEGDVLETTGPGLLTDVYHDTKEKYKDITILFNKDKMCRKWCNKFSCHFGEYAAHFHHGKWRWEN